MNVLLWQLEAARTIRTFHNAAIIYNPNAGRMRRHPERLQAAEATMRAAGHGVTLSPTARAGHAIELAREWAAKGADLVVAAGGDGTINEVLNGLAGTRMPMAILPFGTANVLAMETGIGHDVARAAARMGEMEAVRLAVGLVSEVSGAPRRYFLLMAGAGLDAHIVANLNPNFKKALGKGAYWIAGFQSLARRLEELDAQVNGRRVRSSFVLASRVRNYGGDLEIARNASLLAKDFEVMLFEGSNPFRYLKYFSAVLVGKAGRMRGVHVVRATRLDLEPVGGNLVHLQLDGEDCGALPARVEVIGDAITLLLPPEFVAGERRRWTT